MIIKEDVIIYKLNEIISYDKKLYYYNLAKEFVNSDNYYNRQKWTEKERIDKAYRGFISEYIFQYYIKENWFESNNKIIFDWLSDDFSKKKDKYDVMINWKNFDIKSSKEPKPWSYSDYISFMLEKRNFILPLDQNKKDGIIQIMYNHNNEYVFIVWYVYTNTLCEVWTVKNLKVSSTWYQNTYMLNLKYWNPIYELFN